MRTFFLILWIVAVSLWIWDIWPYWANTSIPAKRFLKGILLIIIAILMMMLSAQRANAEWTTQQKILAIASIAAAAADCYTTEKNLDDGGIELNPIMGKRPNDVELITYFVASELLTLIVAHLCPDYRDYILAGKASMNSSLATYNYNQ